MEKRYKDLLQHIADGKKQVDLPSVLNRSPQQISVDMRVARAELKAKTATHAVAQAIRAGIIR
jgi:hypothetical protein